MDIKITVIGQPNCANCKIVKSILDRKGYDYKYVDAGLAPGQVQKAFDAGFRSLPIIIMNDEFKTKEELFSII